MRTNTTASYRIKQIPKPTTSTYYYGYWYDSSEMNTCCVMGYKEKSEEGQFYVLELQKAKNGIFETKQQNYFATYEQANEYREKAGYIWQPVV